MTAAGLRPRLLFVSQTTPALTGGSGAIRAGVILAALATRYSVTLLLPPQASAPLAPISSGLAALLGDVVWTHGGAPLATSDRFDVVHIAQPEATPAAAPWLAAADRRQLDLGPLRSRRAHRLARLARAQGNLAGAERWRAAEVEAQEAEDAAVAAFTCVFAAWTGDQQALLMRAPVHTPASVVMLPATLPPPVTTLFPPPARGDYTLLFVGDLSAEETTDALTHFCAATLPRIQAGAHRPVRLRIVGEGAGPSLQRLAGQAGVELIGPVPDLEPWYRDAHVTVAPLRAGAGPFLQALEALAQRRPLVATNLGAEGLNLEHGVHALLADDATPFATATLRLLHSPALAEEVAHTGHRHFLEQHTRPVLERIVAALP